MMSQLIPINVYVNNHRYTLPTTDTNFIYYKFILIN